MQGKQNCAKTFQVLHGLWGLCEYTSHSGCWMNSGLKRGFSLYSFTLHTRLILGLYPALEHLHLLIFSRAGAFPPLKDAPCQKSQFMPTAGVCSWGLRVSERDNAKLWGSNMGVSLGHETPLTKSHSSSHPFPPCLLCCVVHVLGI